MCSRVVVCSAVNIWYISMYKVNVWVITLGVGEYCIAIVGGVFLQPVIHFASHFWDFYI